MNLKDVVNGAVGAFPDNCAGYLNPGATGLGYIATLKLSVGQVKMTMDTGLEGIVSYDRAEKNDAYIGQINMLTASSFCGVNGAVWGYHLCKADSLVTESIKPRYMKKRHDGQSIPVWDVAPLLDAAERLFGTEEQRRFPPLPGAMVVCANKSATKAGPTKVWCAIALAIAEDRENAANLFIEDCDDTATSGDKPLEDLTQNIVESILLCGADQGVLYKEIFVGHKELEVPEGVVGCALTCAPYVTLAQNAIPAGYKPEDLLNMSISEWEKALGLTPLAKK